MPIYEYRCPRCGHTLEVMQKVSDPAPSPCPSCQATEPLERLMSRTSFQLKGGGWYSDLYGSVKKDAAKPDAAPAAKAGGDAPAKAATPAAAPAGGGTASPAAGSGGGGGTSGGAASTGGGTSGGGSSSSGGGTP